jgi:hypothetical protein
MMEFDVGELGGRPWGAVFSLLGIGRWSASSPECGGDAMRGHSP